MIHHARQISGAESIIDIHNADTAGAGIQHGEQADTPPKDAPYPMLVGTAITGQSARPPMTLARAPSIPAMAIITRASIIESMWDSRRCRPATPTS